MKKLVLKIGNENSRKLNKDNKQTRDESSEFGRRRLWTPPCRSVENEEEEEEAVPGEKPIQGVR